MVYITTDKMLDNIVKKLNLNISKEDHDYLVCELYRHIDHTRTQAYYYGYEQGKFDEYAENLYKK